jgi:N-acetylmuramoyl-L-alanine amidase
MRLPHFLTELVCSALAFAASLGWAQVLPPGLAPEPPPPLAVVCLDPGHGGKDLGVRGLRMAEKDLSLALCRRVKFLLEAKGYKVVLSREGDFAVPVEDRTGVANSLAADALVSLHVDAGLGQTSLKPRVYSYAVGAPEPPRPGSPPSGADWRHVPPLTRTEGTRLAKTLATALEEAGQPPAAVREAPLLVLVGARMPGALIEVGALPGGEADLSRARTQERLCQAIARGIDRFFRPQTPDTAEGP